MQDYRRLTKKVYIDEQLQSSLRFLYDGKNEIGAVDEQNNLIEFRMLGQGLGTEIGAAVALELQGNIYIPIHDHRGNVALLLDEQGNPAETYRYTAFGKEQSNESINPWRFSSKRMEGMLIYFGKRFYDPSLGRWLSPDPQGFEDGPNLYAYVLNNPMTHFDLYGLFITGAQYSLFNNYKSSSPSTGGYGVHNNIGRAVFNTSANIFNSPRFQGSMQAFGGLVETGVGIGVSLGSYGFAAPVGLPIMAHGLDHFFTGIRMAVSGTVQETATAQLLQKTGMSPRAAGLVDNGISMASTLGGTAVIRASQLASFPNFQLPQIPTLATKEGVVGTQQIAKQAYTNPFKGLASQDVMIVDLKGNTIPVRSGQRLTGSPDGKWLQVRDAVGNPTGLRKDGPHGHFTHSDPRAWSPHAHVPEITNLDGTPWLPIN